MNKKVITATIATIAVVGVAYLGATAYVGKSFQAGYEARLNALEKAMPFVQIVDRKAERSLFTASYSAKVRIGCAAPGSADPADRAVVFGISDHVRHGPLPGFLHLGTAIIDSHIELPDGAPQDLRRYMTGLPSDAIRTAIDFGGGYATVVRLPAGQLTGNRGKASWPAFAMTSNGRIDGSAAHFESTLPEFELSTAGDQGVRVKLAGLRMQGDTRGPATSPWLRPGTSTMEIDSLEVHAVAAGTPITTQLSGLKYTTEVSAAQDLLDGKMALSTNASFQFGRDAKPHQLDKLEVVESFKRLHAPTLQKFMTESMQSLPGCEAATGGTANNEDADNLASDEAAEASAARAKATLQGLLQLLPHNPEFAVDRIAFGYGGRRGELSYSVGIKDFVLKDGETMADTQPRLINALTVKARAKLPTAWVEQLSALSAGEISADNRAMQAAMLLDMAVAKNFVVRDGDELTSDLLFERGVATLNGKPFGP